LTFVVVVKTLRHYRASDASIEATVRFRELMRLIVRK